MRHLLPLVVFLSACADPVLQGPNFPSEQSPWIAGDAVVQVPTFEVRERLVLIGDAGLYLEDDPTLAALGRWSDTGVPGTVLFLGDNIYDDGLVEKERKKSETIISQQLGATNTLKVFIPGNHDWGMDPAKQNIEAILNQQSFIDRWPDGNARWLPRDGCLGPSTLVLSDAAREAPQVVLVLLDPTPFLTPRLRADCPQAQTEDEHFAALAAVLAQYQNDYVIVASHYPLLTGGPHGGLSYGGIGDMIISFIGWIYGGLGNTYEPAYAAWIARAEAVFRVNPPLVYAAGHDHSLQVLEAGDVAAVHVVSGAGAPKRVSTVTNIPQSLFAHAAAGFVVLDFGWHDGREVIALRVVENGFAEPVFEMELAAPASD
jgi:hypothetical protein